uniref:Transposase n=1 Tax=Mesocestoides corti TaxID=53468 RepID=A0A5K3FMZ4_MESCO
MAAYLPRMPLERRETQDWLRPGGPICFIDQSEASAMRQAPSIRVHHAGHAAHYILHLIHVLLWLAAFLSRMPLDRGETRDWLRPGGPTCLRPGPTPL